MWMELRERELKEDCRENWDKESRGRESVRLTWTEQLPLLVGASNYSHRSKRRGDEEGEKDCVPPPQLICCAVDLIQVLCACVCVLLENPCLYRVRLQL